MNNNNKTKEWFEKELKILQINALPSEGNFSFISTSVEKAKKISNHLMSDGILVRQLDSYGLPHCIRITIGKIKEMELTIQSLKKIL